MVGPQLQSNPPVRNPAALKSVGSIAIPDARGSEFDHAAFDPKTRRVFIAHTARNCVEVIDHDSQRHIATLPDFPGVAGAVADDGEILTTNRGAATITWLDAATYGIKGVFPSGPRPNGAAILKHRGIGIAACIGEAEQGPALQIINLKEVTQRSIDLPGRPRWCVTDAAAERLFLCIREPSIILVVSLPGLRPVAQWPLPSSGAHGLDIDHAGGRLYAACDAGDLVEVDSQSGAVTNVWPIAGAPDVTFFNPATGRVHVAIGEPGLIETIEPRTGKRLQTVTGAGAHTTALVPPDRLYVISPAHGGILVLADD
jgi:DNA-binding beta-propeller fold protein YncE